MWYDPKDIKKKKKRQQWKETHWIHRYTYTNTLENIWLDPTLNIFHMPLHIHSPPCSMLLHALGGWPEWTASAGDLASQPGLSTNTRSKEWRRRRPEYLFSQFPSTGSPKTDHNQRSRPLPSCLALFSQVRFLGPKGEKAFPGVLHDALELPFTWLYIGSLYWNLLKSS